MPDITLPDTANLRLAKPEDAQALSALEKLCFPEDEYGEHILSTRQFSHLIKRGNALTIVCENEGGLCGYALILFNKRYSNIRLYSIAVSPEYQGHGIGTALLEATEKIALRAGCNQILLEIREDNETSLQRYLRRRYIITKTVKDYFPGHIAALKLSVNVPKILQRLHPDEKQIH